MPFSYETITGSSDGPELNLAGYCDIWVSNLTSGTVKLQVKFPNDDGTYTEYMDYPDASYTEDTAQSVFFSGRGVMGKLVGTSCNVGVYLRLSRHYNI